MALLALAILFAVPPGSAQTRYRITALPVPPWVTNAEGISASAINDSGHIVVNGQVGPNFRSFVLRNGVYTRLDSLAPFGSTLGAAINNRGVVAGYVPHPTNVSINYAVRWENGAATPLGALPTLTDHRPRALDGLGRIVGIAGGGSTSQTSFLWQNGIMTNLGSLPGGTGSEARDINDSGVVVGLAFGAQIGQRAFRWAGGTMQDLGVLPGGNSPSAVAINDSGVILGQYYVQAESRYRAFRWRNGQLSDLGTLNANDPMTPAGINNRGVAVGRTPTTSWIWRDGLIADLGTLIDSAGALAYFYAVAINNRGEIIGSGRRDGRNGAFLLTPKGPATTRPSAGQFWIGGMPDTVTWTGFTGNVRISFTDDYDPSGVNFWQEIAASVPASGGRFAWVPPDSIASKRCAIKVEDAGNPAVDAVSDTFTVKGTVLTRIGADGNYERFLPGKHGWGYSNGDTTRLWSSAWFSQFDYGSGLDPVTNRSYPQEFVQPPFPARPDSFPSWPAFVEAFGTGACYWFNTFHDQDAVANWKSHIAPYNGTCYGLAGSSLLAFDFPAAFAAKFPGIPLVDSLSRLFITSTIRRAIHQSFSYQFGRVAKDNDVANTSTSGKTTLSRLRAHFLGDSADNRTLAFYNPNGSGAHQVLPYRIGPDPNPNWMRIYVYDSNTPQSLTSWMIVDTVQNVWIDGTALQWGTGFKGMYLDIPSSAFLPPAILASAGGEGGGGVKGGTGRMDIGISRGVDVRIYSVAGDSIGAVGGRAFRSMPDAIPIIAKNGSPSPPSGFYLPSGDYAVTLRNIQAPEVYISSDQNEVRYSYLRSDASAQQSDHLRLGDRMTVRNRDASSKNVQIAAAVRADSSNRIVEVGEWLMAGGDSMAVAVQGVGDVRATNIGGGKSYRLKVRKVSRAGDLRFLAGNITLAANSAHIIRPDWADVRRPVTILVDLGNNGTIDDTLRIANTLDVEDDGGRGSLELPREYDLGQNFPNPFNPSTTIGYALPQSGRVKLTVHDVLGRLVATLVDEHHAAGRFTAAWDGSTAAGAQASSGLYFYRIEITPESGAAYTATRKMVLLK